MFNKRISDIIKDLGIFGEEEQYDVARVVIQKCLELTNDSSEIKEYFGV